jgi:hypothetical protein
MNAVTHPPEPIANPFAVTPALAPPTAASAALVQREVAEVQAAMIIAQRFPRDPVRAMERILTACTRETLAQEAMYQYARGGTDIEGASIRLVEEIGRNWGNILCGVSEIERRGSYSECLAFAWDLETNFRDEKRFQVKHWRDRKGGGGYVVTDERDIYEVIANQGARRKRACLLAVIPADVSDSAIEQCKQTLTTKVQITPQRIASLVKTFEALGVTRAMIEKRIQRRVETITPALMVNLSKVYNSLKDGMSTPSEWFEVEETKDAEVAGVGLEGAKAALRKRGKKAEAEPVIAQPQPLIEDDQFIADERTPPPDKQT